MELVDITFKFSKSLPQFSNNVNMPWNWCVVNVLFEKLEVGGEVMCREDTMCFVFCCERISI